MASTGASGASDELALQRVLRKREEVVVREIAGETLLIPIRGKLAQLQQIFVLTEVGVFIWERLDGRSSLADLRDVIGDTFEVPLEVAAEDLLSYVGELLSAELIVEATDSEE